MHNKHLSWVALGTFWYATLQWLFWLILGAVWLMARINVSDLVAKLIIGIIIAIMLVAPIVTYSCFTYSVDENGVTIREGLFVRKVTEIPYERLQTVQHQQWFFLKPFHLEQLTLETAGKSDAEGHLPAVPVRVGQLIEHYRTAARTAQPQPAVSASVDGVTSQAQPATTRATAVTTPTDLADVERQYQLNWHDLNVYALSSLGIVPIVVALWWLYDKAQQLMPEAMLADIGARISAIAGLVLIAIAGLIIVLSFLVSYLNIVQKYYHFTLTKRGQTLTMTHGYFQRNEVTAPLKRLQAVVFKQNVIRQWLKLSTVQALAASQAGQANVNHQLLLVPVLKTARAFAVTAPFIPWLPSQAPHLTMVPPRLRWYFVRNSLLVGAFGLGILAVPLFIWLPTKAWPLFAAVSVVVLLWAWLQGRYASRHSGAALLRDQHCLAVETASWFTRELVIVPRSKIQSLETSQTYWLKRRQSAHLIIDLRTGDDRKTVTVRYLDLATIRTIQAWYLPADAAE
ncbi:PH domain-containing protein [Lactiplantibacillus modestisalitolerans]|uniref:PH domain-containing protein n=1 Tax=Lactiplantibacillus modestisalitolerans TaxID=1457219 RepID=A0ABV5WV25_9LACO|nr:PH domain-containing protein [Lactiplantibacillus modestisalitolerans]